MTIPVEHKAPKVRVGYDRMEPTKPPNWHSLVTLDLLFNNLATGLFLVAAVCELARPGLIGPSARRAYPLALAFLAIDLSCLVLDLGSPSRFHHMLRVFKPSSPMSLGTWSLTAYSLPLTAVVAIDALRGLGWPAASAGWAGGLRTAALVLGLAPAFASALYKGVLFSTSSQPGWTDARWLGAYLVNSALMFGASVLHALAAGGGASGGTRWGALALIATNLGFLGLLASELWPTLSRVHDRAGRLGRVALAAGLGGVAPMVLLANSGGALAAWAASACLVAGGLAWRHAVVMLPHEVQRAPDQSPA
jgi:hypothetical protein